MRLLTPAICADTLRDIDLQYFRKIGKRGIILDIDNTITYWRQDTVVEEAHDFIRQAQELSYRICLLSNTSLQRSGSIARRYNIPYVAMALKPRQKSFRQALENIGLPADEVIVVGDQLFTDVLGGNRAGCLTILVKPLGPREFIWTKLMRLAEALVLRRK